MYTYVACMNGYILTQHSQAESFVVVKDELHEGETFSLANSSSRPHERVAATSKRVSPCKSSLRVRECLSTHKHMHTQTHTCIHKHTRAFKKKTRAHMIPGIDRMCSL
jgi:hypothetical protein